MKEMAPWLALCITLAISILVPLFTQIANNRFQLKLKRQDLKQQKNEEKNKAYKAFLEDVGGCVLYAQTSTIEKAGASLNRLYLFVPEEWWPKLDSLYMQMKKNQWDNAVVSMQEICRYLAANKDK